MDSISNFIKSSKIPAKYLNNSQMKKILLIVACLSTIFGHPAKLKVSISNGTGDSLTVHIETSKNIGDPNANNLTPPFLLIPNGSYEHEFAVDRYYIARIWGSIVRKGGRTESYEIVLSERSNNFSPNLTIPSSADRNISVSSLLDVKSQLKYDPTKFIEKSVMTPAPADELFYKYLGGVIAYYKDDSNKVQILKIITPIDLGAIDDRHFGTLTNNQSFNIMNTGGQDINANIPVISQLGVGFKLNTLYEIKVSYKGLGVIGWENNRKIKVEEKLLALPSEILYNLGRLKHLYPNLKLDQLNKAYVFDGIYLEINQYSSLTSSNKISGSTFFSTDGYFERSQKSLDSRVFGSSYLGYWTELQNDCSGSLDFALAVYYELSSKLYAAQTDEAVKKDYEELRKVNTSMPAYTTRAQAINYMSNLKQQVVHGKPEIANQVSLKTSPEGMNLNNDGTEYIDFGGAKDLFKDFKLNDKKVNFDKDLDKFIEVFEKNIKGKEKK
jgi:hypothetical protein